MASRVLLHWQKCWNSGVLCRFGTLMAAAQLYDSQTAYNEQQIKDINRCTVSQHAIQGFRPAMEDRSFVSADKKFAAIYDGHGGSGVSQYLYYNLYNNFVQSIDSQGNILGSNMQIKDIGRSLNESIKYTNGEILTHKEWDFQGSAVLALYLDAQQIWTAHLGDSRAVLCSRGRAIQLTADHKPQDREERSRIEKLGGTVEWFGGTDRFGRPLKGSGVYRINGNLAVARAMGDKSDRPFISAEPVIGARRRDFIGDEFVILASDGFWDVIDNQTAVDFVREQMVLSEREKEALRQSLDPKENAVERYKDLMEERRRDIAKYLVEKATRYGTNDNVSIIVMWLQ